MYRYRLIQKNRILILWDTDEKQFNAVPYNHYIYKNRSEVDEVIELIRWRKIDRILSMDYLATKDELLGIIHYARIYGIPFGYPSTLPSIFQLPRQEWFIDEIPVVYSWSITIWPWERAIKRVIDIIFSFLAILVLSPLFILIGILIKMEDPSGPILFKNRRVGLGWKEFFLYKFRYMYWKYCVKDAYGISNEKDDAIRLEEELKKKNNSRSWPLYKIENDPRKMKIGAFIERLSLDELPQFFNVLMGNMSLIWPRPHQPREVAEYKESDYQVLTVKPWISWMAQVYGREKNTFEEEVGLDIYYIEHYSLLLDLVIFLRTIGVVIGRVLRK